MADTVPTVTVVAWPGGLRGALTGEPGKRGLPLGSALSLLREDGVTHMPRVSLARTSLTLLAE